MNKDLPIVVPRYIKDDWPEWKAISLDRMCNTWDEWHEGIEEFFIKAAKDRTIVHSVTIRPGAFKEWAKTRDKPFDGHSRAEFAGFSVRDRFLRPYEEPSMFPKQAEVNRHLRKALSSNPDFSLSDVNDAYLRRPQAGVCPVFRVKDSGEPD